MAEVNRRLYSAERRYCIMENTNLLTYSMELSMLTRLLNSNLLTEVEFNKIKQELMREYNIVSDMVAKAS